MSELVEHFVNLFREEDEKAMRRSVERRPPSGRHNFSTWAHPCKRHRWYARRVVEGLPDMPPSAGEGFWVGRVFESPVADRISEAVGHRFEILHLDRTVLLPPAMTSLREACSGNLDRIGMCEPEPKDRRRVVIDIKRATAAVFKDVDDGPDGWKKLWESRRFWLRQDVGQVVGYIAALRYENDWAHGWPVEDEGILAFVSLGPKQTGKIKLVRVPFTAEVYDECIEQSRAAEVDDPDTLANGGRISFCPTTCGMCEYRPMCLQTIEGPQTPIVEDRELQGWLERWKEIQASIDREAMKEAAEIEERIKERARQSGPGSFFTADARYRLTVRPPVMRKVYAVPDAVKEQYRQDDQPSRSVVNIEVLGIEEEEGDA